MHEWLRRLFHHHDWKVIDRVVLTCDGTKVGDSYYLQYKHCGTVKRRDLR